MRQYLIAALAALSLSACAAQQTAPVASVAPPPAPVAAEPAPLAELVKAVDVPYEKFELANGLTTLVHTDRKAPIVGVTVYYRVGSKHEPRGRTGFAHLYEHLFFGGSENVPNFDVPLEAAGSTSTNGSTWYDRTNYVEVVPKGALDLALFMESDRMGHLLGAVTQAKLDAQRDVVKNEKRQGDNEPYGLAEYAVGDGLFPVGHPYRHSTIGSMADLEAASLGDVRQWFRDNYAPNNVVLALTGDIDAATARPLVEKWFGAIPRGLAVPRVEAGPVTLAAPVKREMTDQVPQTRITRNWSGPGINDADTPALDVAMSILGGLNSSRLDNALVRGEQLAVSVTASNASFEQVGFIQVQMDVKPGVDRARAEAAFDAVIAKFVAEGPSADEVRRAATSAISGTVDAMEEVGGFGGKGAILAEGQLYSGDPVKFREHLARMAAVTPEQVRAAMQRWLTRPAFSLAIVPGERTEKGETMGGWGDEASTPAPKPDARRRAAQLAPGPKRAEPPVAPVADLDFPAVERAKLSNGIPVMLVRRTAIPKVIVNMSFVGGIGGDVADKPGTQALMIDMLDEGAAGKSATALAEEEERLGASINTGSDSDESFVSLVAFTANLAPSLALMADIARRPDFAESEVARVRDQRLAELAQREANPRNLAGRELTRLMFGSHPYGQPGDGLGGARSLGSLTAADVRAAHAKWLRPDLAKVAVAGDIDMARLLPMLETAFGNWTPPATPKPMKDLDAPLPAPGRRIVVIDRPNSPQSVIYGGRVLPRRGADPGWEELDLANQVLGNGFLSRLNTDLREEKGWSYGVSSTVREPLGPGLFAVVAPVQADRTGDALRRIVEIMKEFPAKKPVNAEELNRVTDGNVRGLPNSYETAADVLRAVISNDKLGRPDNYPATLASRYRAITARNIDDTARQWLRPDDLTYVVVGDRKLIEPQLKGIGLPVEYRAAPAPAAGNGEGG